MIYKDTFYNHDSSLRSKFDVQKYREDVSSTVPVYMPTMQELKYYGKLDNHGSIIIPNLSKMVKYEQINIFEHIAKDLKKFKEFMIYSSIRGVIDKKNKTFYEMKLHGDYSHPMELFDKHFVDVSNAINQRIMNQHAANKDTSKIVKEIDNFEDYVRFVTGEIMQKDVAINMPIEIGMFIISNLVSPLSTGLFFDIDDGDPNDVEYKKSRFYENESFNFFVRSAYQHGFRVCRDIPWRLVWVGGVKKNSLEESNTFRGTNKNLIDTIFEILYNRLTKRFSLLLTLLNRMFIDYVQVIQEAKTNEERCSKKSINTNVHNFQVLKLLTNLYMLMLTDVDRVKIDVFNKKMLKLTKELDVNGIDAYIDSCKHHLFIEQSKNAY